MLALVIIITLVNIPGLAGIPQSRCHEQPPSQGKDPNLMGTFFLMINERHIELGNDRLSKSVSLLVPIPPHVPFGSAPKEPLQYSFRHFISESVYTCIAH